MTNQYQWLTYLSARQTLASRLADPTNVFWTDAELKAYFCEALRTWNALTETWNADLAFTTNTQTWYNLALLANSPRLRTLRDTDIYTVMEYHLLEPPTGKTWTGTSQFSIADLQGALQRRRDEIIQVAGCNLNNFPLSSTPNVRRTQFPDSTLEPRRVRFLATDSSPAITLLREDEVAFDAFEPDHIQTPALPQAWGVVSGPPLTMDVDTGPNKAGYYDIISLQAGISFMLPTDVLFGIPDDWTWVAKWGALADLLSRDSEATDRARAAYCLKRYMDGLKIMKESNWLVSATLNGVPVDTPSMAEMDNFAPEWQDDPNAWPNLVQAGMDFVAPCPVKAGTGVSMTMVGNAPCPVLDSDLVQISRDSFDAVLAYAQVLASFKMGGTEFSSTKDLEDTFFKAAAETNKRIMNMGIYTDVVHSEGKRQDENQTR